MKASELIIILSTAIRDVGDCQVKIKTKSWFWGINGRPIKEVTKASSPLSSTDFTVYIEASKNNRGD